MLKNALYTVNPLRLSTGLFLCGSLPAPTFSRYLSTNSAINKGLRKSKDGRSRLDPPARLGGITRRAESHRRVDEYKHGRASSSLRNNRRSEYGREPGGFRHARSDSRPQPRSSDEREPSVTTRKRSPTLRERRTFKAMDGNTSRSRHEPAHDFPRRSPVSNPTFSSSARSEHRMGRHRMESASLNRAERRAAAFGHKEKPPEGYKALPIVSEEEGNRSPKDLGDGRTAMRQHSSINGRAKYGAGANTKDYGEEKRWADRPARRNGLDGSEGKYKEDIDERPRRKSNAPLAIPYTTSASEFLYGHSVVSAALKFSRRKFYKLYLYNGDSAEVRGQDREVRKLALAANVEVTRVGHDWLSLMDKMSGGRPHNGYVLEASPLPKLPVTSLQAVPAPQSTFEVTLNHQSREEEAVNGNETTIRCGTGYRRYPFLLLLDGIRDTGNMGAIFRSAHFLGADGILLCTRNSAALSPVTLKAAAGAAESLPILSVDQPGSFIEQCQNNGWKFYAAVSPSSSDSEMTTGRPFYSLSSMGNPTQEHPCIMILGSEGEGLRWNIQKKADYLLGIEPQRTGYGELDSLNVSVAAALLCHGFLKKPESTGKVTRALKEKLADVLGGSRGREDIALNPAKDKVDESGAAVDPQRLF